MTTITNFFNNDYITFAAYDNTRKIPNICDGLKISQRKVLYTILKNNIDSEQKEIKVEQLSAKASEQTCYLHGANSLNGVAVGMACKYTGSNNINILEPDGNFGTRFVKESSAPRYIYTYLSNIAKYIFKKEDESILGEQAFEGQKIEPKVYYPIIPMILINGAEGLSVGFSCNFSPRNPLEIIEWLEYRLKNKKYNKDLLPYFNNFDGTIEKKDDKYILKGKFKKITSSKLIITEIPIKYSLKQYLNILDDLCEKDIIKSYNDYSNNDKFNFEVKVKLNFFDNKTDEDILKILKLTESITDNFVLLDKNGKIKEYNNVEEILEEYYKIRYDIYNKRKQFQLNEIKQQIVLNNNKKLFIECVLNNVINIKDSLNNIKNKMESLNFQKIDNSYDYLLNMKISSLTKDKLDELKNKIQIMNNVEKLLLNTTIEETWLQELKDLKKIIIKENII